MFKEIYKSMGLCYVEDMSIFEKFWTILKRIGVGLVVMLLIPPIWLFKKINKNKPLPLQ